MRRYPRFIIFIAILSAVRTMSAFGQIPPTGTAQPKPDSLPRVSRFGQYTGYAEPIYDSAVRTSQYVTMRDGVRIAIDIIRPAKNGQVSKEPLPVIWTHNRYRRAFKAPNGRLISIVDSRDIRNLVIHGYVAAVADVRGSGASFGAALGIFWKEETRDAYEITEWLAGQPWSNGRVGMFGGSYLGVTQLLAASTKPPHLKAIFPTMSLFDLYDTVYQGGIFKEDFVRTWSRLMNVYDTEQTALPVDADPSGAMLKKAVEEHARVNRPLISILDRLKFRNGKDDATGAFPYLEWQPAGALKDINESAIPVYIWAGWFDGFIRDSLLMFRNSVSPKRIVVGAWPHASRVAEVYKETSSLLATEEHRWFDYWLKGIDNGVLKEPPIHYQVMYQPKKNVWKTAAEWPLAEQKLANFYFAKGTSGSVLSKNDGLLERNAPGRAAAKDDIVTDYGASTGATSRWDNTMGGDFGYPDMTANDVRGLTYTTRPLKSEIEVTGHPVVHLWLSSTAADADIFAYLEEVDAQGVSHYITEGALRASHRKLSDPPYDNGLLPYHRSDESDILPLKPGEPAELIFDLEPTSNVFNTGNRMRLTICGADKDNAATPRLDPAPTITIYREKERPSFISLPLVGVPSQAGEKAALPLFLLYLSLIIIVVLVIVFAIYARSRIQKV